MLKAIYSRIKQGYRTMDFPAKLVLPENFKGRPLLDQDNCQRCRACAKVCPTDAITFDSNKINLDLGKCIFCSRCAEICSAKAITFSKQHSLAARSRSDLILSGSEFKLAQALGEKSRRIFGRSLKLRQVSAGGCGACEADSNVLTTLAWDLGRYGIQFVASPRHADGLLVTGTVPQNMVLALKKTYDALPAPKFVVAVGACAISGGPYIDHLEQTNGTASTVPVDLYIPGCPPHPATILDGLLRLLGRLDKQ